MMGHKICLFGEIWKIISKLYLLLLLIWSSVKVALLLLSWSFAIGVNIEDLTGVVISYEITTRCKILFFI